MEIIITDNLGHRATMESPTTVRAIYEKFQPSDVEPLVLAMVNNDVCDFDAVVEHDAVVQWLSLYSREGVAAYQRTLSLLLAEALAALYPDAVLQILHSLENALYCEVNFADGHLLDSTEVEQVESYMRILQREKPSLADYHLHFRFIGHFLPDMRALQTFDLQHYAPGFLARYPSFLELKACCLPETLPPYEETPKFAKVFLEVKESAKMMHCAYVPQLNEYITNGTIHELIEVAEAIQDKQRAQLADTIASQYPAIRLVLISGPSSSGKTTFTKRLATQLRVNNRPPLLISLDDYYYDRDKSPRLPDGTYDFESLEALQIELFAAQLRSLFDGHEIYPSHFDFQTGKSGFYDKPIALAPNGIVIVEGLHALNDELSRFLPRYEKYKIYLGAFTQLGIDRYNRISTSDARLLRRLVRDYKFRNNPAEMTFSLWENVRRGEENNIYPRQEGADTVFNTSLIYELSVLKTVATPLLQAVPQGSRFFHHAARLLRLLEPFQSLDTAVVPEKSLLREFIGEK